MYENIRSLKSSIGAVEKARNMFKLTTKTTE